MSRILTLASATFAPEESVTSPVNAATSCCALAGCKVKKNSRKIKMIIWRAGLVKRSLRSNETRHKGAGHCGAIWRPLAGENQEGSYGFYFEQIQFINRRKFIRRCYWLYRNMQSAQIYFQITYGSFDLYWHYKEQVHGASRFEDR